MAVKRRGVEIPTSGPVGTVVRDIGRELIFLQRWEVFAARQRELLLAARAALRHEGAVPRARRRRVSQDDVADYLAEHPGCSPAQIGESLRVPTTTVSSHLYRGKNTRYERRLDGWYLRSQGGGAHKGGLE
jgi:hypothetical protein